MRFVILHAILHLVWLYIPIYVLTYHIESVRISCCNHQSHHDVFVHTKPPQPPQIRLCPADVFPNPMGYTGLNEIEYYKLVRGIVCRS